MKKQSIKKHSIKRWIAGILTAALVLPGAGVVPAGTAQAAESVPGLTVNMAPDEKRELYHGATGWLYGLGDDEVPTANTITALKPNTAVQKAPRGMQHPNGDVLDMANTFKNAGGKHIQIYVPDYYALWFYEFTGTDYYLDILRMQAEECIKAGIAEDAVWVLYNEPNENWVGEYHDDQGNKVSGWNSLYWFWKDMVEELREVYRENGITAPPKTAGLNLAVYNEGVMRDYMTFCKNHDCLPDIISWHDLSTWQYNIFDREYNHYRSLEKSLGIEPREIVINEYADRAECASPGNLVRWIGLWEDYQVAGCLPFWHLSNNLNGLAADTNEGNGAWWLYKWYGDMSGNYLPVSTSGAAQADFYGAASLDENKKSANVIFGGQSGSSEIVLDQIDRTGTFKDTDKVHIKVEATDFTGFHGTAEEPYVVKEGAVQVVDGRVSVPMSDMNALSAYRITVTQAAEDENAGLLSSTWKEMYEAEKGVLAGNAKIVNADWQFACSNRQQVQNHNTGDSFTIDVKAPKEGYYRYDMLYGAATGVNTADPANHFPKTAVQKLIIDGGLAEEMVLQNTVNWSMEDMYSTYIYLTAGNHKITVEGSDSEGKAVVDCIYLTYKGKTPYDTAFDKTYEAELGEFNEIKGETTKLTTKRDGAAGYITGLEARSVVEGGGVRFNVVVPDNGMYRLALRYQAEEDAKANIYLDNDMVNLDNLRTTMELSAAGNTWRSVYQNLFLQKGVNVVDIDTEGAVKLDSMSVSALEEESTPVVSVEAEDGTLAGTAAIGKSTGTKTFASGNSYVAGMKAANGVELIEEEDPDFTILGLGRQKNEGRAVDANSLTLTVEAPEDGTYKMVVYQSNGELFGKHDYNAQMTERFASFRVNDQEAQKVVFRNTYSDESFRPQVVNVNLRAGTNTVKVYNDNSRVITNGVLKPGTSAHRPENIDYAALENYTPNFDKFEFYRVAGEAGEVLEESSFAVNVNYTEGGIVDSDKETVNSGEDVRLTFVPNDGCVLVQAVANGQDITESLSAAGGIYTLRNVRSTVNVEAYFTVSEESTELQREKDYEYAVNAGDVNPATLSEGDTFGVRNSVTDQFYGGDPETGARWGVVDKYVSNNQYPDLLTGEKTWPCENDGATDTSPKGKSFRYARNQPTTDVGVVYQFMLEPGQTYKAELGFYVPGSWTNASNPRTMKLVVNDTVVSGYEKFEASNNSDAPYVISTQVTADENGDLKIQIGHADNAKWGPVVSYINIFRPVDTTSLENVLKNCEAYHPGDYPKTEWDAFDQAYKAAEALVQDSSSLTDMVQINDAQYNLQTAVEKMVNAKNKVKLDTLCSQYGDYAEDKGQGLTSEDDWYEFQDALLNAVYINGLEKISADQIARAEERLAKAAEKLNELVNLEVKAPSKITYYVGEGLDITGMEVRAYGSQGGDPVILESGEYTIGDFDFSAPGTKTIAVSYRGKTAEFTVRVAEAPVPTPELQGITATAAKTIYEQGEKFDLSTLYVTAHYSDGSSKSVTDYQVSGFDSTKPGSIQITVTYQGKTASVSLTVKEKSAVEAKDIRQVKPSVKVTGSSYSTVQIGWRKVEGAEGYQIYRAVSKNGTYRKVKTVKGGNTLSFTDQKKKFNKTYYYKVRAYRTEKGKAVTSKFSNILAGKVKLEKPVVTLRKKTTTGMSVTWKRVAGASGYQVRYSLKKKSGYKTATVNKGSRTKYMRKGLKKGKTYYVKVRAYRTVKGKKVYSPWSALQALSLKK